MKSKQTKTKKIVKIEKSNLTSESLNYSKVFEVSIGGFGNPEDQMVTYNTKLKIADIHSSADFRFFEEVSSSGSWPISKIIQREIGADRVKEISEGYINAKKNIKYFPPITIAFLPKNTHGKLADAFTHSKEEIITEDKINYIYKSLSNWSENDEQEKDEDGKPTGKYIRKEEIREAENLSKIKGLILLKPYSWINYSLLSWDKEKYYAIVIDGQHRLSALFKSYENNKHEVGLIEQDFVIIDVSGKSLKYNLSPTQIVRSIFIDINQNPKKVSRNRTVLMDDLKLSSRLVQVVVNDEDNTKKGYFIPPQLINWHTDDLKHNPPYISSILGLDEIFASYFLRDKELTESKELKIDKKVKSLCEFLNGVLGVDDLITQDVKFNEIKQINVSYSEFKKNLDDAPNGEQSNIFPFNFDYRIYDVAAFAFENRFAQSFVYVITNLLHYKIIINEIEKLNGFDSSKNLCTALTKSEKKRNQSEVQCMLQAKDQIETVVNKRHYLLNTVLGQKAIFSLYYEILFKDLGLLKDNKTVLKKSTDFVNVFNLLISIIDCSDYAIFGIRDNELKKHSEYLSDLKKIFKSKHFKHEKFILDDITYSFDGQIQYKKDGIDGLQNLFFKLYEFCEKNYSVLVKKQNLKNGFPDNLFENNRQLLNKIKTRLKKGDDNQGSFDYELAAQEVINIKSKSIKDYLDNAYSNFKKSK